MPDFGVSLERTRELRRVMRQARLFEKDLDERFVHASGPGGQNVNKVATCVQLAHRPTGMLVKCQAARSQALNRYHARLLLLEKMRAHERTEARTRRAQREKDRRRRRRRSAGGQRAVREMKERRSQRKSERRRIRPE